VDEFALVFGADGVHSRVRELVFGPEDQFARYLGYYVAAFHTSNKYGIGNAVILYEEPEHLTIFYPLDEKLMGATYIFFRFKKCSQAVSETSYYEMTM
jgi:2-polyprenyl-6-methoxyphenol hydroxylase-like FAD-dependent oxidoreductase